MEHHVKIDSKYGLEKVTYFVASFYEEAFLLRNTFYNTSCTFAISVDAFPDFFKAAESHLNREKLRARGGEIVGISAWAIIVVGNAVKGRLYELRS